MTMSKPKAKILASINENIFQQEKL